VVVAVVGGGSASAEQLSAAREVGRLLGERGCVVVTGGLGGVMAAASEGAASCGAVVVGLLPGLDRAGANEWVSVPIPTGMGELRNGLVVRAAEGLIAVGGEFGTLSEVALALKAGKPVVGLDFAFDIDGVVAATSPADAVSSLLAALP
jgi:uncharacterized protein (TIGR00725 family)